MYERDVRKARCKGANDFQSVTFPSVTFPSLHYAWCGAGGSGMAKGVAPVPRGVSLLHT